MKKCPCCGYNPYKKYNYSMEIISLLSKRKKITKSMLRNVSSSITAEVLSDDDIEKKFKFLKGISHIEDRIIQNTIANFCLRKMYMEGYGFDYLKSMILKEHQNAPKKRINEYKRYGKPPSKRKEK
tara:strand:- start:1501 stop:1878 length:378 start_codon:yes stop_codon:yes gene_type:complete